MSSLINSAMSGLGAAQATLNTVSNNISSYNVAGYTRQNTILGAANSTLTGGGWVGNGVYVSGVQREYDAFITNQLRAAQTQSSGLTTRYQQMSKIDDVLSDTTNSLSTTLQDFFKSLQTLVSNAEDPAARQTVLGKADGLVNQFKTNDQYLRDQDAQVNTAISSSVSQINNYAKQIANLNDQISRLTGVGAGASPNDLLDQRDQLVTVSLYHRCFMKQMADILLNQRHFAGSACHHHKIHIMDRHFPVFYCECSFSVIRFIYMKHSAVSLELCCVGSVFKLTLCLFLCFLFFSRRAFCCLCFRI